MSRLPVRPDLAPLVRQAEDLLQASAVGDAAPAGDLATAQETVARDYGFASWSELATEVERRDVLNSRDLTRVRAMLSQRPELAATPMRHWRDHDGVAPVAYMAMLRFDAPRLGLPRELPGTGEVARMLLDAGAPVDGDPSDTETPLITAASYGDADVARALIDAGANVTARATPDAGGVPGSDALGHAAVFGMTDVLDLVVAAGARPVSLEMAAAVGDISGWRLEHADAETRIRALTFAADHERLDVIDALVAAGTPVDAADATWDRQPLRLAAQNGRPASVRRLLEHGADANLRDADGRTALDLCGPAHRYLDSPRHDEVAAILRPLTRS